MEQSVWLRLSRESSPIVTLLAGWIARGHAAITDGDTTVQYSIVQFLEEMHQPSCVLQLHKPRIILQYVFTAILPWEGFY